jgi:hypothetical protein
MATSTSQTYRETSSIETESTVPTSQHDSQGGLARPAGSPNSVPMPPANQVVLLGFVAHGQNAQRAVYGPPGASYDSLGNVYFDLGKGRKQWIGSYKDASGNVKEPPKYWLDTCCCIQ